MAKVPVPAPIKRVLSLRPEHRKTAEVSLESRDKINEFVKKTRNPFGEPKVLKDADVDSLEKSLRELEKKLFERERNVEDREAEINERERSLWESEALLKAREDLLAAREEQNKGTSKAQASFSGGEREAMLKLQEEVERQQASLEELRKQLQEREEFVKQSEEMLFNKTIELQEKETLFEQRLEDLVAREQRQDTAEGNPPPEEEKEVL